MADPKPAPIDTSKGLTILARRGMWRGGRQWNAGANDVTATEAEKLGQEKLQAIARDPNFTIAAAGTKAVTVVSAQQGEPIEADTVVHAKRPMWRAGRQWVAGVTPLTADQVKQLGAGKIATLKADPNFTVTQNSTTAAAQQKAEAATAKPAAPAAAPAPAPSPTPAPKA